jgi:hypothetical protein
VQRKKKRLLLKPQLLKLLLQHLHQKLLHLLLTLLLLQHLLLMLLQHLLLMLLQHLLLMPLLLLQHQKLHLSNLYLAKKESLCSPFFIAFLGSQKNKSFHKEALILNMPTQSLSLYAFFLSFE